MEIKKDNLSDMFIANKQLYCDIMDNIFWIKRICVRNAFCYLLVCFGGEFDVELNLDSVGADLEMICVLVGQVKKKNKVNIVCRLNNSFIQANIRVLSFLPDQSDVQVNANIVLKSGIQKSSWHLLEENIVLWDNIRLKTLPMLDVCSNDVQASHGAKVHSLDSEKLFYMMTRWLPREQARSLLIEGHIDEVLEDFLWNGKDDELMELKNEMLGKL